MHFPFKIFKGSFFVHFWKTFCAYMKCVRNPIAKRKKNHNSCIFDFAFQVFRWFHNSFKQPAYGFCF